MSPEYDKLPEEARQSIKQEVIYDLLKEVIGQDPTREGLRDTPKRMVKAWQEWTSGYALKAEDILKVFEDGAEGCDQMVVRKNIPIYSHCEHHLAAIIGRCTIAYIPNGKVVGLSKMDRIADMFARRLQVQERMTNQIADAMNDVLKPIGVGVWISARHLCVESRGVKNQDSETVTVAVRGAFLNLSATRAEFLALARA
jgi:GTP cyclohydrolase I